MGETRQVATRLAVAALLHESNAFVPALTPIEAFVRLDGALLEAMARGSGTEVDGALARAEAEGAEAVLTTAAFAPSSGPVEPAAADQLVDELVAGIAAARHGAPLDAVVVCLHGSMASPGTPDVEGRVLGELRRRLGPGVALVATLDWHCSITPAMADAADALVAYRTYPHIDQYERGAEAAGLALRLCRGTEAHAALVRPPMLVAGPGTRHEEPPMAEVLAAARDAAGADPRILAWSVCPGFARSDDPASGVAVYVAATDPGAAGALAVRLAEMMWDRRALFRPEALEPAEAVTRALRGPRRPGPVVVSDQGDNPGGGAAGDGTALLAGFLAAGPDGPDRSGDPAVRGAAAVRDSPLRGDGGRPADVLVASLYDPDAVARCAEAGVGATLELSVGGHTDDRHGPALSVTADVLALGDGDYTMYSPTHPNVPVQVGPVARVRVRTGAARSGRVQVLLTSTRVQNEDLELLAHIGADPMDFDVVVVKSNAHFRAAFGPIAAEVIDADTPGLSTPYLERLPYRRVRRPIHPLDDTEWTPTREPGHGLPTGQP